MILLAAGAGAASADLVFPSLSHRTGPYSLTGAPFADGFADYFTLLNERDGGINGIRVQVLECETGHQLEKGLECYEATKGQGTLVYHPLSAPLAQQLMARAATDGIPLHMMGYGPPFASEGRVFPWIFSFPATDWDAASIAVLQMLSRSDGRLWGRRVALVHLNNAYGREPVGLFRALAWRHGFGLRVHPIEHPGQEQKAAWRRIERDQPDFVVLWGWGVMNLVAIEEAGRIGYPVDRIIGGTWSAVEAGLLKAGEAANGFSAVAFHGAGTRFPLFDDLRRYVLDNGKAAGDGIHFGHALYNRGLFAAVLAAEAARKAMAMHNDRKLTPAMMRDGLENLELDGDRLEMLGLAGFAPEIRVTCANHGGPGLGAVQQWNAREGKWLAATGFVEPDRAVLERMVAEAARAYAEKNGIAPAACEP